MRIRTLWLLAFVWALLPVGGCEMDRQQQIEAAGKVVDYLQGQSALFDARLAVLNGVIEQSKAALADPNLPAEATAKIRAVLEEAQAELAKVGPAKAKIDFVLADVKGKLDTLRAGGEVDLGTVLQTAAGILGTTGQAVGGQVGGYMQLAAAIIIAVLGAAPGLFVAKKRSTELRAAREDANEAHRAAEDARLDGSLNLADARREADEAIGGIVASVSKLLADSTVVSEPEKAKDILAREQVKVPAAATAVRKVLDAQKPRHNDKG